MLKDNKLIGRFCRAPEFGVVIGWLVVFFLFSIISKKFLTINNFAAVFTVAAELGITAIGINLLVISGEFDLSVGSTFAIAPMVFALVTNYGVPPVISFIIAMIVGLFIGAVNGLVTIKNKIPSFITTMGMMMFWRGVLLAVSKGFPVSFSSQNKLILHFLNGRVFGYLRYSCFWFLLITITFTFVLTKSKYGNWVFATGGNADVAKALGINTSRVKIINFLISALLASFGGCISLARFNIVDPTLGTGLELEALSAVVIGGTLLSGGYGSIVGTFIGAILVGMVRNGLILAGAPAYWYTAFIGILLIVSVSVNSRIRRTVLGLGGE